MLEGGAPRDRRPRGGIGLPPEEGLGAHTSTNESGKPRSLSAERAFLRRKGRCSGAALVPQVVYVLGMAVI
jgi:hypothetical protein